MNAEIEDYYRKSSILFEEKKFHEVIKLLSSASAKLQSPGAILILLADSYYEIRNDLMALQNYAKYISLYPNGRALQFALFNSSICLKNIGLELEAKRILNLVNLDHPGLQGELADSEQRLHARESAQIFVESILAALKNREESYKRQSEHLIKTETDDIGETEN